MKPTTNEIRRDLGPNEVYEDRKESIPAHPNTSGVVDAANDTRFGVIERAFLGLDEAASVEQALLRRNLGHFSEAGGHSPLVLMGRKEEPTLLDHVLRVTGRR